MKPRFSSRGRTARVLSAIVFVGSMTVPTMAAGPAMARCDAPTYIYKFTHVTKSKRLTNLRSDYLKGPGNITYSTTKTASTKAEMTASVSAEAGVVFAKASTSIGVTVGKEWSKSGTWSYEAKVEKGRTARLVMWHKSRSFLVTKKRLDPEGCSYHRVYRAWVDAPVKANTNVWALQDHP